MRAAMLLMIYVGALLTTPVLAQNRYQKAELEAAVKEAELELCNFEGRIGRTAYQEKQRGGKRPNHQPPSHSESHLKAIAAFSVDYGYTRATSEKDAYRTAWAHCMDNIDR